MHANELHMRGWVELNPITCIARIVYSTAFLLLAISLPTCESSAYVVDPSKNANNIVNPDYIVSLTVNDLHNTCREVVFMQQTYILMQAHAPFTKRERVLSHCN